MPERWQFTEKKCTQVKVIQAAGKVVAYREKVYTG